MSKLLPAPVAYWQDVAGRYKAPVEDAPMRLSAVGKAPTILVECGDRATVPVVAMTVLDAEKNVVASKLDANYPWRVADDAKSIATLGLAPGVAYTLVAVAYAADRKTAISETLVRKFTIAGEAGQSPPPQVPDKATDGSTGQTGGPPPVKVRTPGPYRFGVCGFDLKPDVPVTSRLWTGTKTAAAVLVAVAAAFGTGKASIRNWWNIGFSRDAALEKAPKWDRLRADVKAGVGEIILILNAGTAKVPTVAQAKEAAEAIRDSVPADLRPFVKFEVGNEIAFKKSQDPYFSGTVEEYATQFLTPFYDVLHPAGFVVIAAGLNNAGPGLDPATVIGRIIAAGGKCDAWGWHPYPVGPADYERNVKGIIAVAGGKPIYETESNTKDGPGYKAFLEWVAAGRKGPEVGTNPAEYVANWQAVDVVRRKYADHVETVNSFSLGFQTRTMTGPLGWFVLADADGDKVLDGAKTTPIFDALFADVFPAKAA